MPTKPLDKDCSPVGLADLKARLISPHLADKFRHKPMPGNVAPMANTKPGMCNTYLPAASGWDRLLFVMQAFIAQGMYVVLDYQPMGLEQHAYDLAAFVDTWAKLWKQVWHARGRLGAASIACRACARACRSRCLLTCALHPPCARTRPATHAHTRAQVSCLPNFQRDMASRVFIDVMNEPDSMNIRWEGEGARPGAHQLYLGTADALWRLTPGAVMFFFEGEACRGWRRARACAQLAAVVHAATSSGCHWRLLPHHAPTKTGTGQNMFGLNWGNGFITDQNIITSRGMSDPNDFFQDLLTKPYLDEVRRVVCARCSCVLACVRACAAVCCVCACAGTHAHQN